MGRSPPGIRRVPQLLECATWRRVRGRLSGSAIYLYDSIHGRRNDFFSSTMYFHQLYFTHFDSTRPTQKKTEKKISTLPSFHPLARQGGSESNILPAPSALQQLSAWALDHPQPATLAPFSPRPPGGGSGLSISISQSFHCSPLIYSLIRNDSVRPVRTHLNKHTHGSNLINTTSILPLPSFHTFIHYAPYKAALKASSCLRRHTISAPRNRSCRRVLWITLNLPL